MEPRLVIGHSVFREKGLVYEMLKRIVFERRLEREVSVNDSFDANKLRILHNV